MKKVDKDPFSNGTEYMMFCEVCCDNCIKHSRLKREGDTRYEDEYTKIRCAIERDIITRMCSNEPISERTIKVCDDFTLKGVKCPYMVTEWPKRAKKQPPEQLNLFNE